MAPLAALWSDSSGFLPHGYCLAWDPALLWTIVLSHAAIGISYFSIPVALLYFVRRQQQLRFNWMFLMFGAFILGCGASHVVALIEIWHPLYRADASILAVTGGVSLATALLLWPLVPRVSGFLDEERRNREALQAVNQRLSRSLVELEQRRVLAEESERLFRLSFEQTPIGKALVSLEGRCLDVNQALCDMLGYTEAELLGVSFEAVTHPEDFEADLARFKGLVEGRGTSYRMEKRYFHKSGRVIRAQLDVAILRDEQGRPLHMIAQVQDITARLQVQAELEQSKQRLEAGLARVQRQNEEITSLGELSAILHKCQNFDEMTAPMSRFGPMLFPGCTGALYLMHASRNYLDRAVAFGEPVPGEAVFDVNACWALRRGQAHWHGDSGLDCAHLHDHPGELLICAPMMAQGETIGTICLRLDPALRGEIGLEAREHIERLAMMVADRVGIAIANVRLRETLRLQSIRDPLTGLLNRRYLEESLPRELDLARREQQPLAVLMIDVDHFKRFNDTHGHEAGDQALRLIGRQLMSDFRGSDMACRLGGEEFAVVMPRTALEQARQRAEMLRQRVGQLSFTHHGTVVASITLSVGIACYPEHGQVMPRLVDAADQALYRAKRAGRNRVVCVESAEAPEA